MKRGLLLQDLFVGVSRGGCGEPICDWQRYTARSSTTSIKFACWTNAPAPVKANSVSIFPWRFRCFHWMYLFAGGFSIWNCSIREGFSLPDWLLRWTFSVVRDGNWMKSRACVRCVRLERTIGKAQITAPVTCFLLCLRAFVMCWAFCLRCSLHRAHLTSYWPM